MNVVVEPLFVSIAERNIQRFDVIPLFYDAHKAAPEELSQGSIFKGLKRAHDYSNSDELSIGKISNMLTRLWNKDKPDRLVAAWLTRFNNDVIEGAKTGQIDHYNNYPAIEKKINKAIGGKKGRMPYWFKFSKNARGKDKKDRKYLEPNNSTMNRICAAFGDIGNINLHMADVPPFNWQMLLSEPCTDTKPEVCETFCCMDNANMTNIIDSREFNYVTEREQKAGYDLLASMIVEEMTARYGPLEETFPYVTKYLFAGRASERSSHKQMYWRVYGQIALENLKKNLISYQVCPNCNMKYPAWAKAHACPKDTKGFFTCVDCNKTYPQLNSRQCRCQDCQDEFRHVQEASRQRNRYRKMKKDEEERTGSLVSRLLKT